MRRGWIRFDHHEQAGASSDPGMKPIILITPRARACSHRKRTWKNYAAAITLAGGQPEFVGLDGDAQSLQHAQGLLLIGGGDLVESHYGRALTAPERATLGGTDPDLDRLERELVQAAVARDLPTLGICRGMQVLNWALGGRQLPDIKLEHPDALPHRSRVATALVHPIEWRPGSRLGGLLADCRQVNSTHHQAVAEIADGLRIAATAPDGIIEALEKPAARFCCGVQFHPERMLDTVPAVRRLFKEFVREAGRQ